MIVDEAVFPQTLQDESIDDVSENAEQKQRVEQVFELDVLVSCWGVEHDQNCRNDQREHDRYDHIRNDRFALPLLSLPA